MEDEVEETLALKLEEVDEEIDPLKGLEVQTRKLGGVLAEAVNQDLKATIVQHNRIPKKGIYN